MTHFDQLITKLENTAALLHKLDEMKDQINLEWVGISGTPLGDRMFGELQGRCAVVLEIHKFVYDQLDPIERRSYDETVARKQAKKEATI